MPRALMLPCPGVQIPRGTVVRSLPSFSKNVATRISFCQRFLRPLRA